MSFHDSRLVRLARRGLILTLWGALGYGALLAVLFLLAQRSLRDVDRRERTELTWIFSQAIVDGTVPDPPVPADAFVVTSRHGNEPYQIRFTNAAGRRSGYVAFKNLNETGVWTFKALDEPSEPFQRKRVSNE